MAEIYTLYVKYRTNEKGEQEPVAYAYGDEWVAMALYMDESDTRPKQKQEKHGTGE